MTFNYQIRSSKKKDGTQAIRLKITNTSNDIQYFNTGVSIMSNQWDKKKQLVKKHPILENLNAELNELKISIQNLYYKSPGVSASRLKQLYINHKEYDSHSFIEFYQKTVDEMVLKDKIRTAKTNQTYIEKLKQFQSSISFNDLSPQWAKDYEKFMLERKNKTNTIASNFKGMYAALNKAVKLGLIEKNPIKGYTITTENVEKQSLTLEEIQTITDVDIHQRFKGMIKARDMFLFSFYTAGMRFTDMCKLQWSNIIGNDIVYTMNKSNTRSGSRRIIPLNPKSIEILETYKGKDKNFVFPPFYGFNEKTSVKDKEYKIYIQNNTLNRSLKSLAIKCEINKPLTMHMGKHSFADYAVKSEVDLLMISKLLGHTKLSTTEHYLKDFYHKEESDTMTKLFG